MERSDLSRLIVAWKTGDKQGEKNIPGAASLKESACQKFNHEAFTVYLGSQPQSDSERSSTLHLLEELLDRKYAEGDDCWHDARERWLQESIKTVCGIVRGEQNHKRREACPRLGPGLMERPADYNPEGWRRIRIRGPIAPWLKGAPDDIRKAHSAALSIAGMIAGIGIDNVRHSVACLERILDSARQSIEAVELELISNGRPAEMVSLLRRAESLMLLIDVDQAPESAFPWLRDWDLDAISARIDAESAYLLAQRKNSEPSKVTADDAIDPAEYSILQTVRLAKGPLTYEEIEAESTKLKCKGEILRSVSSRTAADRVPGMIKKGWLARPEGKPKSGVSLAEAGKQLANKHS